MTKIKDIHPGVYLQEILEDFDITAYKVAKDIGVPKNRIREILEGTRSITIDTGLRLSKYFGQSESFWINMQKLYDMKKGQKELARDLRKITPIEEQRPTV